MAIEVTSHPGRRPFDLVIAGGRVIDPANGVDGRRDVAIADGRVVDVSTASLRARGSQVVHADGHHVLPGLVDVHTHCSSEFAGRIAQGMLVRAGVTTAIDLAGPVHDVIDLAVRHPAGLTLGCLQRLKPQENLDSNDPGRPELRTAIRAAVRAGALGVKILGGHFPLTPDATAAAIQQAAEEGVWIAFHCGTTATIGDFEGLIEALELKDGAPLHLPHVNAYCRGRVYRPEREALRIIELLQDSARVFSESYLAEINGTWGRCDQGRPESAATRRALRGGGYEPTEAGLERAIADGYALVHIAGETTVVFGQGPEGVDYWRRQGTNVGISFKVNQPLAAVLLASSRRADGSPDITALASDGGGIPRNEILRWGYRLVTMGLLSMADLVGKASRVPASYLGLPDKGHLGVGADADVVVAAANDGTVFATVAGGQLLFDGRTLSPAPTTWLATDQGVASAKAAGLDVRVIDPFNEGSYGAS